MAKQMQSAGLAGARILGERKVASLLQFSWATRHDSSAKKNATSEKNGRKGEHGAALSKRRQQKKG